MLPFQNIATILRELELSFLLVGREGEQDHHDLGCVNEIGWTSLYKLALSEAKPNETSTIPVLCVLHDAV